MQTYLNDSAPLTAACVWAPTSVASRHTPRAGGDTARIRSGCEHAGRRALYGWANMNPFPMWPAAIVIVPAMSVLPVAVAGVLMCWLALLYEVKLMRGLVPAGSAVDVNGLMGCTLSSTITCMESGCGSAHDKFAPFQTAPARWRWGSRPAALSRAPSNNSCIACSCR